MHTAVLQTSSIVLIGRTNSPWSGIPSMQNREDQKEEISLQREYKDTGKRR